MKGKPILSELQPYQQGKQTHEIKEMYGLEHIVKLASNENVYGFSEGVQKYLQSVVHDLHIYPDGYTGELRQAVSEKLQVSEDMLIFGSGTEEVIQMLCRAMLVPNDEVIMATPTFPQYKHYAKIEGTLVHEISVDENGGHPLNEMLDLISDRTRIIWLCSPNNPTGNVISKQALETFLKKCPEDIIVVLDEAYYEFISKETDVGSLSYLEEYPNLLVLRTFSKAYGLAGLRIGYGVGNPELITLIDKVRGPFNTSSVAQRAATIALQDEVFIERTNENNRSVRQSFEKALSRMGWEYYPSEANFLLVKTPETGIDLYQFLLEHGFITRPGELLGIPNTVRITIGKKTDMEELASLIKHYDRQHGGE